MNGSRLGTLLTVLGFVTAVVGPIVSALKADPLVASQQGLSRTLAVVGIIVVICGAAHDGLVNWININAQTQIQLAQLRGEKK